MEAGVTSKTNTNTARLLEKLRLITLPTSDLEEIS